LPSINLSSFITINSAIYLWKANEIVLKEAGVLPENIFTSNICTACNPDLLYSHRIMGDIRGNMAAFLALK